MSTEAANQVEGNGEATEGVVATDGQATGAETQTTATAESVSTEAATTDTAAVEAAKPVRPEGLPDQFWDDTTGLKLGDLAAFVREAVEAKADVPESPDKYELRLPADLKIPDGYTVTLDKDDPLFKGAVALAHKHGQGQGFVDELAALYARAQIANQDTFVADFAAERGKLGENAKPRIEAVTNWATASFPKDQAEALQDLTDTAAGVQALETIIKLRAGPTSPGAGDQTNGAAKKSRAEIMYPDPGT